MKVSFFLPFITIVVFSLFSCGGDGTSKSQVPSNLPSITFPEMKKLMDECDFIDIIFYTVDFSMSVNTKSNIERVIPFVSPDVAVIKPNCQPIGRIFYQIKGVVVQEADIYLDNVCQYFVFYKDKKQIYANKMTPEGQAYFNQIFSQVKVEPTQ